MNPVYQYVNDVIIEKLKQGTIPWQKTWKTKGGLPKNMISKKVYSGINTWMLLSASYASPWFVSYKQAADLGGNVRKGEKGHLVVFWTMFEDKKDKTKKIPMLRYYKVFNLLQCEGIEAPAIEGETVQDINPIEACQSIVSSMPKLPTIEHGKNKAYYQPSKDLVGMPDLNAFTNAEAYYATMFHELSHATGHESRLCRKGIFKGEEIAAFGSKTYSQEELVAEMASAFLCGESGIVNSTIDNSAAYIQGWMKALDDDPKILVHAAGQAQKAADFILNKNQLETLES